MKTKQTRREEAAARFRILPFMRWCQENGITKDRESKRDEYDGYLARKGVEATALNIGHDVTSGIKCSAGAD